MTAKKFAILCLQIFVFAYIIICIGMTFAQSSLLFHPTHKPNKNPEWTTGDIDSSIPVYAGVVFGSTKHPEHVYLLFHGNTGQADGREYIYKILPPGSVLFVMEYPGYGKRGGAQVQEGLNATALRSYDYLEQKYLQEGVNVIGESLGTGLASYVASQRQVDNLYLLMPYQDLPALAQEKYPWLPTYWLCSYRWNNAEMLKKFKGRLVIVGAKNDEVIPPEHARKLASDLPSAHLEIIDGTHNDWDEEAMKNIFAQ